MKIPLYPILLLVAGFFMVRCNGDTPATWQRVLEERLPVYGHRNWIVIADAAYPSLSRPGVETIATREDHLKVLAEVLRQVGNTKHVRARVYLARELAFVTEQDAPGVSTYREALRPMLGSGVVDTVLHEDLMSRLDDVSQTFDVLFLKTTLTIPYTSVLLELGCGYWPDEAESRMRESMKSK